MTNSPWLLVLVLSASGAARAAEDDTVTLNLTAKGKVFIPAELVAPAGKRVEIMVKNEGPGAEEFESKDLKREKVVPEGQTVKVTIGTLKAGTYHFFGDFRDGKGTLKVADASAASLISGDGASGTGTKGAKKSEKVKK